MSGPPPAPEPLLVLQLHVMDGRERSIDQRQLLLILEEGTPMDLGSMNAYRLSKPGARVVEQNLTARVPAMQFRALARATSVRVQLGADSFSLTHEQINDVRSLYAGAVCGGKLK